MSGRSSIRASPAFDAVAHGAQSRDQVAVVVRASPEAILRALREVRLADMKLAWPLGEIRYLPWRLVATCRRRYDDARLRVEIRGAAS